MDPRIPKQGAKRMSMLTLCFTSQPFSFQEKTTRRSLNGRQRGSQAWSVRFDLTGILILIARPSCLYHEQV